MKKNGLQLILVAIIMIGSFSIVKNVLAGWNGTNYYSYDTDMSQWLHDNKGYVYGSSLRWKYDITATTTMTSIDLYGAVTGACLNKDLNLTLNGQTFTFNFPNTTPDFVTIDFGTGVEMTPTSDNIMRVLNAPGGGFCYEYDSTTDDPLIHIYGGLTNPLYDDVYVYTDVASTTMFYFDSVADCQESLDYGLLDRLSDTCPDVTAQRNQICYIGEDCKVWFDYNDLALSGDWWAVPELKPFKEYEVGSGVYGYDVQNRDYWTFYGSASQSFATGTTFDWCMWSEYVGDWECLFNDNVSVDCGFGITFVDKEEYLSGLQAELDEVFDEIASSTLNQGYCDGVCTETTGFFACGIKKGVCYITVPNPESQVKFENRLNNYKNKFPLNIYTEVHRIIASSTATSSMTVSLPLYNGDLDIPLSSSTVVSSIGTSNYSKFYGYMQSIIYLVGFGFILFTLIGMLKTKE